MFLFFMNLLFSWNSIFFFLLPSFSSFSSTSTVADPIIMKATASTASFQAQSFLLALANDGWHERMLDYLRNLKLELNWRNHEGRTALHEACSNGNVETVKFLVEQPGIDVNVRDHEGRTPLLLSVKSGDPQCVRILLDGGRGIDAALADYNGWTPLWWAAFFGDVEVVELLIAIAPDLGDLDVNPDVDEYTDEHEAVMRLRFLS